MKSFANTALRFTPKKLSAISSIPSSWTYSYSASNIVANVAYDIFLDTTSGSSTSAYEIMVWLAAYGGAGPIGSQVRRFIASKICFYCLLVADASTGCNSNNR